MRAIYVRLLISGVLIAAMLALGRVRCRSATGSTALRIAADATP